MLEVPDEFDGGRVVRGQEIVQQRAANVGAVFDGIETVRTEQYEGKFFGQRTGTRFFFIHRDASAGLVEPNGDIVLESVILQRCLELSGESIGRRTHQCLPSARAKRLSPADAVDGFNEICLTLAVLANEDVDPWGQLYFLVDKVPEIVNFDSSNKHQIRIGMITQV